MSPCSMEGTRRDQGERGERRTTILVGWEDATVSDTDLLAGIRNGTWLGQQNFSGVREARELLDDGQCSPQCLLAREPGSEQVCVCPCRGRYHGVLATALVPVTPVA